MYVPADYNGQDAWPLVINYHGFRTGPEFQVNFSQMNAAADSMSLLVAYPQGLIVSGMLGAGAGWAIPNVQSENDDISFSNELIDRITAEYNVDMDRIHLTGWSQGSAMSYYLACSLPDRIASVAGVAGQMPVLVQENCEPGRSISTMHFHGTLDPIVPFEGIPSVWPPPPETSSFWAENNNCAPDSVVTEVEDISTSDSTTVTRIEYIDCEDDTEVVFYRINDGGHPWPGSTPVPGFEFLGHTNQDINATAEILSFFERNPKPASSGGVLEERSFTHNDSLRSYLLYVPASYDGQEAWPLVINYHGLLASSSFQNELSMMNTVADTTNFIIAYPQGLEVSFPNFPSGAGWNLPGFTASHDDLSFTDQLVEHIRADFSIDLLRIHATGWSNGSMMSFYLACESSDLIASVAGVAASMTQALLETCEFERPISTLYIHGTSDPIAPYEGTNDLTPAETTRDFWIDQFNCFQGATVTEIPDITTADSSTVTRFDYDGCDDDIEVQFYRINNGGHTWPDGGTPQAAAPLGHVNRDFNASAEILSFFERNPKPEPSGGVINERSFVHNDSLRSYLLYVPASYDGSSDWPLVINFHGFNDTAAGQVGISQMNAVADTAGYLVAYPQGLLVANPFADGAVSTGWNVGGGAISENDDIDFSKEVINHIVNDYRVDASRIHVTGFSMGANMSYEFVCAFSNDIASFATVSGQMDTVLLENCNPGKSLSFLQIHGDADPIVPFNGAEAGGFVLPVVTETASFWAEGNNCSPEPMETDLADVATDDSSTVTLQTYIDCDNESEVRFYKVNNGGHTWPGGAPLPPFLGFVNRDFNASAEIISFFDSLPRPIVGTYTEDEVLPRETSINIYPNPFARRLTIDFDTKEINEIEITLFNVLGQEVSAIANQSFSPGEHQITWSLDEKKISSGLYFVRMKIGEELITKPILRIAQ